MSQPIRCPHCGTLLAAEGAPDRVEEKTSGGEPATDPAVTQDLGLSDPDMPLLAAGSHDETFLGSAFDKKLAPAEPDPFLGKFTSAGSGVISHPATGGEASRSSKPHITPSSATFPAIQLDPGGSLQKAPASNPSLTQAGDSGDDDEEAEEPRRGWGSVLIASYASAVTLALAWFVIKDRGKEKIEPVEPPKRVEHPEQPTTSDLSKKVQLPEPILAEHMARFGQPIQIGSLEITPLDVKRQDVRLKRANVLSVNETRDGGKKALFLRLKLRNTSEDTTFAPLDPAYLRERGEKLVDTFVTTADHERVYPYRLALESEWSIVGQEIQELRPGESKVVAIVTAPDAPPDSAGPFTWRVRLRTGISRTDVIGLVWPDPPADRKSDKEKAP